MPDPTLHGNADSCPACELIRSILDPIEKADPRVVRVGKGVTMTFGS